MPANADESGRRSRWTAISIGAVLLLLVTYVLASGPLLYSANGPVEIAIANRDWDMAEHWVAMYQPVLWVYHATPLGDPLDWYFDYFRTHTRLVYPLDDEFDHIYEELHRMPDISTPYRTHGSVI